MNKLFVLLDVFRRGSSVADPDLWKNRAGAVAAVAGLISALVQLARLYGYEIPLDADGVLAVAGGLVTLVCMFLAWGTSKGAGILPPKPAPDPATEADPGAAAGGQLPPDAP